MLIPSIDLQGGRVVQLVQGRDLALASDDVEGWARRFSRFPAVQVIDLDAAMDAGSNATLTREICTICACRVGGGVRSLERAAAILEAGATKVIVGSALFGGGGIDEGFADRLAHRIGADRVIAAVDSLEGRVVVRGWRERTPLTTADAVRALEPYCGEFLYTHVDTEGLMTGIDLEAVRAVRQATGRPIAAAGGITSRREIEQLAAMNVDAVVGMAIYTGRLAIDDASLPPGGGAPDDRDR